MKKLLFIAITMALLSSCLDEKEEAIANIPEKEGLTVTVTFTGDPAPLLKSSPANFVEAEPWEKELKTITILAFKENGQCILQRDLNAAEIAARVATFTLPFTSSGELIKFHAVANITLPATINDLTELEELKHVHITSYYSYSYGVVSTRCMRNEGFGMSGYTEEIMASEGQKTSVAISLKRLVTKIRVKINITEEFYRKYKGYMIMWPTDIENSPTYSWIVEKDEPLDEGRTAPGYIVQDNSNDNMVGDSYQNLFYIYENGKRAEGDGVKLRIRGTYNEAGLVVNAILQTYIIELDLDPLGEGIIRRNCCYDIEVDINDLQDKNLQYRVSAARWEMPFDN